MPTIDHPVVGRVSYQGLGGGRIKLLDSWGDRNVDTVFVPQLKGVPTYEGRKFSGNVPFYSKAIPQLLAAFRAVERAGLLHRIIFWAGSWVPRLKRGSNSSPSEHTFATAFDINPAQNGFREEPARKGEVGYLRDVAQIFKKYGFSWGGDWRSADGMHIQVNRILSASEIAAIEARAGVIARPVAGAAKPIARPVFELNGRVLENARMEKIGGKPTLVAPVRDVLEVLELGLDFRKHPTRPNVFALKGLVKTE